VNNVKIDLKEIGWGVGAGLMWFRMGTNGGLLEKQ
jgi:hypothetical protein